MIDLDNEPGGHGAAHIYKSSRVFRVVGTIVAVVLGAMVLVPVAQIIARRVLHDDVPGASIYTQHLTLWAGFLGAILASIAGKHLSLSTANLIPKGPLRRAAEIFSAAMSTAVVALLAYGSLLMVLADRARTSTLAGGIPEWWSEAIMPLCLGVIAVRGVVRAPHGWSGRIVSILLCAVLVPLYFASPAVAHAALWPGLVLLLAAFLLGAPVFVAMAGAAMLLFFVENVPVAAVPTTTFQLVTNSTLPAVPLLTICGYVLAAGGASQRMVNAYRALLGWLPGGMGLMVLAVCALFTAFTGASGVTILAMGGLVYPSLREEKYPEGFSLGLVTAAGSLGLLLPPSLPVILYAVVAQTDVKHLFIGGIVPGLVIIILVALYTVFVGVRSGAPRHKFSAREAGRALWLAKWDLGLPLLVIGSILSGLATIVESAAIAALYAVIIEVVVFRNIKPGRDLRQVFSLGATLVGAVLILMGVALGLTAWLVDAQIPDRLLEWVQTHIREPWQFLLVLNIILLVLGSVLEMYSAIVVLAPLVVPIGQAFNIDPVHLGVVFLANLELGFLFPPMGLNLFLSATRFSKPLPSLYRHAAPFLIIMTVGVLIVTYVPAFTNGVLRLLGLQ